MLPAIRLADLWPYLVLTVALGLVVTHVGLRYQLGCWMYHPVLLSFQTHWVWLYGRPLALAKEAAKFADHQHTVTTVAQDLTPVRRQRLAHRFFAPLTEAQVWSMLDGCSAPAPLFTVRSQPCTRVDSRTRGLITDEVGTSWCAVRPVQLWFRSGLEPQRVWWLTFGPTDLEARLVTTHVLNQQQLSPAVTLTTISCRHNHLLPSGVAPFCRFRSVRFSAATWRQPPPLSAAYKLLSVQRQNFHFWVEFVESMRDQFEVTWLGDVGNMVAQVQAGALHIWAVVGDEAFRAGYVFRRTGELDADGLEYVTCVASLSRCESNIFVQGFKVAFWQTAAAHRFGGCEIDDVSHNGVLIQALLTRTPAASVAYGALYFHGAAIGPSVAGHQILVVT